VNVRYAGSLRVRSERSPPARSASSCSRDIELVPDADVGDGPIADSREANGDVIGGDVGGKDVDGGMLARLAGSSTPRIARHASAPAERTSTLTSSASACRIVASS